MLCSFDSGTQRPRHLSYMPLTRSFAVNVLLHGHGCLPVLGCWPMHNSTLSIRATLHYCHPSRCCTLHAAVADLQLLLAHMLLAVPAPGPDIHGSYQGNRGKPTGCHAPHQEWQAPALVHHHEGSHAKALHHIHGHPVAARHLEASGWV